MPEFNGILAVHSGALGDVILLARLLESTSLPVTLVAKKNYCQLLAGLGRVENFLDFDSLPMHEIFSDTPVEQCKLTGLLGGRDLLVSCFAAGQTAAERRLAEIAWARRAVFLPIRPGTEYHGHLLDLWRDASPDIFPPNKVQPTGWPVPGELIAQGRHRLQRIGVDGKFALIHPGSGSTDKNWPVERFVDAAMRLSDAGLKVVFVLGPVEQECWDRCKLEIITSKFPMLMNLPLPDLAGAMSLAAGYMGNDSGVTHLAAAVGAPTVAIFVASDGRHFSPIGPKVTVVRDVGQSDVAAGISSQLCGLWPVLRSSRCEIL